jgi:hypothetical protein
MKHECPDLIPVLAELARRTWKHIKTIASKIYELVQPPRDLRVYSTENHEYSGVILVDHNEVEGGAVAKVGYDASKASGPYGSGSLVTPPPSYREPERSPYLKSWAEDPRQEEEDESWRYR